MNDLDSFRDLKYGEIQLREDQLIHFSNCCNILSNHNFFIDCSPTGRGKTYISLFISQFFNIPLVIFTEKNCVEVWKQCSKQMNITIPMIIPYTSMPGKNDGITAKGLLERTTTDKITKSKVIKKVSYKLTELGQKICKDYILIFDEYHKILGKSLTFRSSLCISKEGNKMGFLSATPADNVDKIISFMKIAGICKSKKLTYSKFGETVLEGIIDIFIFCLSLSPERANRIYDDYMQRIRYRLASNYTHQACIRFYQEIIRPAMCSRMDPFNIDYEGYNGFYKMTPDEEMHYCFQISNLANTLQWNGEELKNSTSEMGNVFSLLRDIEISKIGIFYRQVRKSLEQDFTKVVVWVHYISTLESLEELLSEYNCSTIRGSTSDQQRTQIISDFQEASSKTRVLLISSMSLSTGISLHDCNIDSEGNHWKRDVYISPSFRVIDTLQFIGRFLRVGYLSIPRIYIVYPEVMSLDSLEYKMIQSQESKLDFLEKSRSNNTRPMQFLRYVENN